jgi:hypothetical protein
MLLGLLLLTAAGVGYRYGRPVLTQYRASVVAPDSVAGLDRLTDDQLTQTADQAASQIKQGSGASNVVVAFYASNGDRTHMVMVAAATHFSLRPAAELDQALQDQSTGGIVLNPAQRQGAGALGGTVECGAGTINTSTSSTPLVYCGWSDYGSVGFAIFYGATSVADSAAMFGQIRTAVLHRR